MNKLLYAHGMNESDRYADQLQNDWNTHLFGKTPIKDSLFAFWGDLSVSQEFSARASIPDVLLRELYKVSTHNRFLGDCYNYFYNPPRRTQINQRFFDKVNSASPLPTVVLSHSLGTVIAFACLSKILAGFEVPLFITVGSPLGLGLVQAELKKYLGVNELVAPACVKRWINFSDLTDIVAIEHRLAPHFGGSVSVEDVIVRNPSAPGHSHDIDGYLQVPVIQAAVKSVFQP